MNKPRVTTRHRGGDAAPRGYDEFGGSAAEFTSGSRPWWPSGPAAARGNAPNVVVVLVDDLGFSDLGPFGSEIDTPNVDRLSETGWTFSNFHTSPMCSPSRAALMTGLNPHRAGFGFVAHIDPGYPGYSCELPQNAPTLAESLRADGYATFMVGKWHLTIESKLHDGAERSSWPLQRGFDRYFGSMDGFTSVHHPHRLIEDNSPVQTSQYPSDFFLTDELTDRAIGMIDDLRANDADKPFFLYFAHTAVHGPLQAKKADIAKYAGQYARGWDDLRQRRFARQRELGIVADDAVLPETSDGQEIPRWEDLAEKQQKLFARHMEVYAAAVDEVDQSVGRLLQRLEELGEREDTIVVVTSDNGGTAEGGSTGTRSYFAQFGIGHQLPEDWVPDVPRDPELIGGPQVFSHYPAGWARVSNTPFRAFKQHVYEGGVHSPLVLSWPAMASRSNPGRRDQYSYIADLAPTILDLTGVPALSQRGGRTAAQMDGRSFAGVLQDEAQPARQEQYFECVGRRAMYAHGWKAVAPAAPHTSDGAAGGPWELYDLTADPTESTDLAGRNAERVEEMAQQWRHQAWHNTVLPLDDDGGLYGVRPSTEAQFSRPVELTPFRTPLERFRSAKLTVLRSFQVEADIEVEAGAAGVIMAHGDQGGGYALMIDEGAWVIAYNAYGQMHHDRGSDVQLGRQRVLWVFTERPGLRWDVHITVGGTEAARIDGVAMILGMAPFTGISVGYDHGSPVDWGIYERHGCYRLSGATISKLQVVPGPVSQHDPTVLRQISDTAAQLAD